MENITGHAVTNEDYLHTRLFLIEDLKNLLKKGSVIIEAPRRFGKTSVVKEFMRQEKNKGEDEREFNILFLELEGEDGISAFCLRLFKELLNLYYMRKQIDAVSVFLGDAWNVLASRVKKFGILKLDIEIKEKTRDYDFSEWKGKIASMINGLNSLDKKTIIVFDEFPDMLLNFKSKAKTLNEFIQDTDKLTAWLRLLRQTQDSGCKYQFVFCGSINLRKTLEEIGISKRINDLESLVLPPLKEDEAYILISNLVKEYELNFDEAGISYIANKVTDGSPYYGQILFKAFRDTREKTFDADKVKSIYEDMLRGGNHDLNHYHSRLEKYLSLQEKELSNFILRKLCNEKFYEKEFYDLFLYKKCDYEKFQSIINRLIYEGYIMRDINNKGILRFVSPLLKDWWACKVGVK